MSRYVRTSPSNQVETSSSGVFMGVYDGHGGPEASAFVESALFGKIQEAMLSNGGMSEQTIIRAFEVSTRSNGLQCSSPFVRGPKLQEMLMKGLPIFRMVC